MKDYFNQLLLQIEYFKKSANLTVADLNVLEKLVLQWQDFDHSSRQVFSDNELDVFERGCTVLLDYFTENVELISKPSVRFNLGQGVAAYRYDIRTLAHLGGFYDKQESSAHRAHRWAGAEDVAQIGIDFPGIETDGFLVLKIGVVKPDSFDELLSDIQFYINSKRSRLFSKIVGRSIFLCCTLSKSDVPGVIAIKNLKQYSPVNLKLGTDKRLLSFSLQGLFLLEVNEDFTGFSAPGVDVEMQKNIDSA